MTLRLVVAIWILVLVLSEFTGAARDLQDAVLVNPYDVEATADAIRWAGLLLGELSGLPVRLAPVLV